MKNLKILVVDDDPVTRLMLKKTLSKSDFDVDVAEDGVQAVELISRRFYDVVLTDMMMPGGMDGIDVLAATKAKYSDTEVILITGYGSVDTAVIAMKKGAADYLQKPINIDEVLLRLAKISKMKSLAKNAGDLREAMAITEKNAGETIQLLEIAVSELENKLEDIKDILSQHDGDAYERIDTALRMLA
jgi:two-component system, OmpR family, response regulator